MFAHIRSGGLVKIFRELPFEWEGVKGFPALSAAQRALYGVVPLIDVTPPFDPTVRRYAAIRPAYTVFQDRVEVLRAVEDIPPVVLTPEQQAELERRAILKAEVLADAFIEKLRKGTPLEIKKWVQDNITDLPTAKAALGRLAVAEAYSLMGK